jgi:Fur family ferric uptake transcriptional regulator
VEACPGNLAALAPPGFTVEDHDLTLYGACVDCAPARAGRGRRGTRGGGVAAAPKRPAATARPAPRKSR